MGVDKKLSKKPSVEEILNAKRTARDRLIEAVYAADRDSLERAAESVKAALRGDSPIPRPQRFVSLDSED
ncbi:hypothetical protein FBY04_11031 [Pseudomonas sp. SJZ080]|nr:hypothetical protein FBY04_11031 [Pseudomonas sp. SJZ080]